MGQRNARVAYAHPGRDTAICCPAAGALVPALRRRLEQQLDAQAQELAAFRTQNAHLRAQLAQQHERDAAQQVRLERLETTMAHATTRDSR